MVRLRGTGTKTISKVLNWLMKNSHLTRREQQTYQRLLMGEVVKREPGVNNIIQNLRSKLGKNSVETRYGEGYILGTNIEGNVSMTGNIRRGKEF